MGLDNLQDILSVKDLSEFMKVSDQTIKRAIKSGKLKAFKVGKEWRIEREAVMEWVKNEEK